MCCFPARPAWMPPCCSSSSLRCLLPHTCLTGRPCAAPVDPIASHSALYPPPQGYSRPDAYPAGSYYATDPSVQQGRGYPQQGPASSYPTPASSYYPPPSSSYPPPSYAPAPAYPPSSTSSYAPAASYPPAPAGYGLYPPAGYPPQPSIPVPVIPHELDRSGDRRRDDRRDDRDRCVHRLHAVFQASSDYYCLRCHGSCWCSSLL